MASLGVTLHKLPELLVVRRPKTAQETYLFDFVDLFILEEAGQAAPAVLDAALALAKKAVIIADTK